MKKLCFKKVQKCLKERVCLFTCSERKNLAIFCSTKGFIYILQKLNVAYCLTRHVLDVTKSILIKQITILLHA